MTEQKTLRKYSWFQKILKKLFWPRPRTIETQLKEEFVINILPKAKGKSLKWKELDAELGKAKVRSNQGLQVVKVKKK